MKNYRLLLFVASCLFVFLSPAQAHPYASSLTNAGNGTMRFYLNESADSVSITFEDSSHITLPVQALSVSLLAIGSGYLTNDVLTLTGGAGTPATIEVTGTNSSGAITNFTLLTAGSYSAGPPNPVSVTGGAGSGAAFGATLGVPSGQQTFALGTHANYTISVAKTGGGAPALITTSPGFTPRGVAVNQRSQSPYFGRVYVDASGAGGIFVLNSDMTFAYPTVRSGVVTWSDNGISPYRLFITPDDYLMVGDASSANAGVFRIDPTVSSNEVFLGPIGEANGEAAGVFGTIQSKPLILGNPSTGPVTLMDVDGDLDPTGGNGYNSILVYTNIILAALPWTNPPDILGPDVGVTLQSEILGDNEYPGLSQGGGANGYIYASTYRLNLSNPLLQIYDPNTLAQVWNSYYNNGGADYFLTTSAGHTQGIIDSGVSPDGKYVAGLTIDNWFVICPLTNGMPDVGNLFLSTPTSYTGNGRGMAWDAADNLYLSSSGIGLAWISTERN